MRVLTDADIAKTAPTEDQLRAAIKSVCAMDDETFFDAAVSIGLDPWAGMRRDRVTNERTWGTGRKSKGTAA